MAPVRRYLRITATTVLEVRLYLDDPADAPRWLLRPRDPALPRIVDAVRPLVLPKLREENENARRRGGGKRKGIKDVVRRDDFEVSIFLTDISAPHAILTRQKLFHHPKSPATAAAGGTQDQPVEVADDNDDGGRHPLIRRESSDEKVDLDQIPLASERPPPGDEEPLFISDEPDGDAPAAGDAREEEGEDDKKKLGLTTAYDGFQIYGRILCLIVNRKGGTRMAQPQAGGGGGGGGQARMEEWIASTQEGSARAD